jgi:hypothetical protein
MTMMTMAIRMLLPDADVPDDQAATTADSENAAENHMWKSSQTVG